MAHQPVSMWPFFPWTTRWGEPGRAGRLWWGCCCAWLWWGAGLARASASGMNREVVGALGMVGRVYVEGLPLCCCRDGGAADQARSRPGGGFVGGGLARVRDPAVAHRAGGVLVIRGRRARVVGGVGAGGHNSVLPLGPAIAPVPAPRPTRRRATTEAMPGWPRPIETLAPWCCRRRTTSRFGGIAGCGRRDQFATGRVCRARGFLQGRLSILCDATTTRHGCQGWPGRLAVISRAPRSGP